MSQNICNKFGTPQSVDLQNLQEICQNITASNPQFQKFLLFIAGAFSLFLILVFFAKVITSNKTFIHAYYKSSFTYFIQIFTVITIIPIISYLFDGTFEVLSKLVVTFGVLGMIFVMFEYWPVYKKDVEVNNSIVSTLLVTVFVLSFYSIYNSDIKNEFFIDTALIAIFSLYLMIFNIFIKLAIEVQTNNYDDDDLSI